MIMQGTIWLGCGVIWATVLTIFYWSVIDRQHPVKYMSDKAVYHSVSHRLELSRELRRNRFCEGTKHWYIQDGFKQPLPDEEIPSTTAYIIGHDRPGEPFTAVIKPVDVDPRIMDSFDVIVTTKYQCNFWQRWFPLIVETPIIHVPQEQWNRD